MKTLKNIPLYSLLVLLGIGLFSTTAFAGERKKKSDQDTYLTIKGKVVDEETGAPLIFASVAVSGANVAIVTNIDGEFTLKIAESLTGGSLEFTFIGYKNKVVPISSLRDGGYKNVISLEPAPIPIREIIVRPIDPDEIVRRALTRIDDNYATIPNLMTAFYRETIRRNRNYVSLGEAVVEIFKAPYANDLRFDYARMYKGRKSADVEKMDTVLFKLQGGPVSTLELDIVKSGEAIFTTEAMKYYDYTLSNVIEIDGKPHYVIEFYQRPSVDIPLFMGSLYIEMDSYALTEAEFGFNLSDKEAAQSIFIRKKPLGMEVTPEIATYRTKYREQDGKWYFAYSRAEVRFKVNWKKKLFNTYYTTMAEIAITDRTEEEVIKFAGKEKLRYSDVFSEKVSAFADADFWGEYNVIEPDQSIESAIRKLSRKLKFSDRDDLQE
ncbi:MAG: carboxypeptidase-like regulatory domain-containing protein [Bacteroidales bacterium]|nr:carboxypeptidase-like regulatory domain-containing protein [Bacteroidales bacterium]MBN2633381.1 carboxypeptidase-like regulatory domain-containing protein [Bacteroidales bacterium]